MYKELENCNFFCYLSQLLSRNRAPSSALPFPVLTGANNTWQMRLAALNLYFTKLTEASKSFHHIHFFIAAQIAQLLKVYWNAFFTPLHTKSTRKCQEMLLTLKILFTIHTRTLDPH